MSRQIAFDLLSRVENDDAYANLLLPTLIGRANLDSRDAGFVQELAFGTIRNKLFYERIIESASSRKFSDIEQSAGLVLLLGTHQLLEMRVPSHAAINESVNLAKRNSGQAAVGFVNAVLRKISSKDKDGWLDAVTSKLSEAEALSVQYSHPSWIVNAFKLSLNSRGLVSGLEDLLESNNKPAKVSICALPGLVDLADTSELGPAGSASPIGFEISGNPSNLEIVRNGKARVQDQGSQLAALVVAEASTLSNDDSWLDMCAGPGGKAALLAALAQQRGTSLTCNEISEHRAALVRTALKPFSKVKITVKDGRNLVKGANNFSRILLDAPCTGLGALRRRPESRWRRTPADLADLVQLQRELIESAWEVLKPGGILGYVTCSPHLSETTAQVSWAQSKFKNLEILNANTLLNSINPALGIPEEFRTAQLWPHIQGTDAMFIAIFRKTLN